MNSFREWCKDNEPVFRFFEVVFVLGFGTAIMIVLTYQQGQSADAQVRVAKAAIDPHFKLTNSNLGDGDHIGVVTKREDVRVTGAQMTLFIERLTREGYARVAIKDFFTGDSALSPGRRTTWRRSCMALTKFLTDGASVGSEEIETAFSRDDLQVKCLVCVFYEDALGDRKSQWLIGTPWHGGAATHVDGPVALDATLSLASFKRPNPIGTVLDADELVDFASFRRALDKATRLDQSHAVGTTSSQIVPNKSAR